MNRFRIQAPVHSIVLVAVVLALAAPPAQAGTRRAGGNDLFFGLGFMAGDEARIDGGFSLESEESNGVALRWRLHFTDFFALETDFAHQSGRVRIIEDGNEVDSREADTTFFLLSGVFNLTRTPVSPFISAGFGSFDHESDEIVVPVGSGQFVVESIREEGGVLTAAVGLDGRTEGMLTWLFEVRLLDYDFDGFDEDWNRLIYSGYIGLAF